MKKIILVLMIMLLCACKNKTADEQLPTREDVLLEQAKIIYQTKQYEGKEENLGKMYFTPIRSIVSGLQYAEVFNGCDMANTGFSYTIKEENNEYYSRLIIYIYCDNTTQNIVYKNFVKQS